MAHLGLFNAHDVPPSQDYSPIPTGDYLAQIIDSAMKATQRGDGQYLELVHQILEGEHKGRLVWARLNLDNPSPKTVQIAQQNLSAICHAIGVMQVQDSTQLHHKPLGIRVEFVSAGGRRRHDSNEIRGWRAAERNAQPAAILERPTSAAPQPIPPATSPLLPWKRQAA